MDFLPIFLEIREQPCPVVGGGEGAARFVRFVWRNAR
jgi:siroheme synthase (precorrin-2 oxidase/ferrochelatase)